MVQKKINFKNTLFKYFPLILLYFSVLNEFDIDVSSIGLFSFNLPFIIIFYCQIPFYKEVIWCTKVIIGIW